MSRAVEAVTRPVQPTVDGRHASLLLSAAALVAVQRDAAQCCREAFYAH